ncbi:MAG: 4-hydroxybenzoate polyprenyltransferase/phosphoserine phosphatase [Pseudohongiellaceae bacterium]|jgi:4-hydroxybenzoate polyprenyltransferase/phosphoserine phosphatase
MANADSSIPLFVDLDGTLIKTDTMVEAVLSLLRARPLSVFAMLGWLAGGKAVFKAQLAKCITLDLAGLPINPEFLAYLEVEHAKGRRMTLISASHQSVVDSALRQFEFFVAGFGSDDLTNLKSEKKLQKIQQLTEDSGFAYAGDSSADLVIWQQAEQIILVNCDAAVTKKARQSAPSNSQLIELDQPPALTPNLFKAMRVHQWLKNLLVFLPLILSHQLNQPVLLGLNVVAFISFCFCASSVYLLNDLLDLSSDRTHDSKSGRPFAAGTLPLKVGLLGTPVLFAASVLLAIGVGTAFLSAILLYWAVTCLYSFYLKRVFLVDVVTLAFLFTMRVVAGSAAIGVVTTDWLLAFTGFLFLGLAVVKRVIELTNLKSKGLTTTEGRGYSVDRLQQITILGSMSSLAAVVIFAVYINSPATLNLYQSPNMLWGICPLLLIMLARVWRAALSGDLNEDPVLFAAEDRPSQIMLLVCAILLWLAI